MRRLVLLTASLAALGLSASESLEEIERRECLKPGPSPMDAPPTAVTLRTDADGWSLPPSTDISLDGTWQLVEDGKDWAEAVPAEVPGSVHCALMAAGRLDDPYFACNDLIAKKESFKDWRLRREFMLSREQAGERLVLSFGGVCHTCQVTLNGRDLGRHVGMFGGPDDEVTGLVHEGKNVLEVKLERAPFWPPGTGIWEGPACNWAWRTTVAFNCCYGWHYAQIPALGIWRSVRLRPVPTVAVEDPFVSTVATNGTMDFFTVVRGTSAFAGTLEGEIRPANFAGRRQSFSVPVSGEGAQTVRLRFQIAEPRLWWPNGLGEQNLYTMKVGFRDAKGGGADGRAFNFGIRTIEMRPAGKDGKPSPEMFNWKLVVNGVEVFMKGTGWCTTDALMRFTDERYRRFLGIAKRQNVNFIRAWGGGLVETDAFYDLCDQYGF